MEKCEYCLRYTNTIKNVKQHIRRRHPDGDYVCPSCGGLYTTNKLFQEHLTGCIPAGSPEIVSYNLTHQTIDDDIAEEEDIDSIGSDIGDTIEFKKVAVEEDTGTEEFKSLLLSKLDEFLKNTDSVLNLCVKKKIKLYFC